MATVRKNLFTLFIAAVMAALLIPTLGTQTAYAADDFDLKPCQGVEKGKAELGYTISFKLDEVIDENECLRKARETYGAPRRIGIYDVSQQAPLLRKELTASYDGYCYWTLPSDIGLAGETFKIRLVFGNGGDFDPIFDSKPIMAVANISGVKVPTLKTKTYTGKPQTQSLGKITKGEVEFTEGVHYTVVYKNNINAGTATVTLRGKGALIGSLTTVFTINKAANPLKVKGKTAKVKYNKLKKKNKKLAVAKVINFKAKAKDKKQYALASAKKGAKSFKKYFSVNATSGKVTVKKGLKKGTYKVKIKVKARGDNNYKASSWKTVACKVKVV